MCYTSANISEYCITLALKSCQIELCPLIVAPHRLFIQRMECRLQAIYILKTQDAVIWKTLVDDEQHKCAFCMMKVQSNLNILSLVLPKCDKTYG